MLGWAWSVLCLVFLCHVSKSPSSCYLVPFHWVGGFASARMGPLKCAGDGHAGQGTHRKPTEVRQRQELTTSHLANESQDPS